MPEIFSFQQIMKIHKQEKQILIGPRSAVFAPFADLQLILVDEEHDNSYKQNTQFSYHGKDVAVVRAQKKKIPIVLGSATPSAETYWNAKSGKYHLLQLKERVLKQALPEIILRETSKKMKGEVIEKGKIETVESTDDGAMIDSEILNALRRIIEKASNQS